MIDDKACAKLYNLVSSGVELCRMQLRKDGTIYFDPARRSHSLLTLAGTNLRFPFYVIIQKVP